MITSGIYEHYKGGRYEVIGVGKHEATHEEMVVYRALYGDQEIWIRPLGNFMEDVEIEGERRPRFRKVD